MNLSGHAGVYRTECHDRYFMVAVDLSFTGEEVRFEAAGKSWTASSCFWDICNVLRTWIFKILKV